MSLFRYTKLICIKYILSSPTFVGFFVSDMMGRFVQGYSMRFICILSFITITNAAQVTFIVDMSEETVVAGEGNYPAVYVSGSNLNGPSGIEMTDNGEDFGIDN